MKCLSPQRVYNKYLGRSLWTACGRCSHCLENRRTSWLFRLDVELEHCYLGVHATLQFDNDHIGENVLDKRELQLLFKKLRKRGLSFSYYAVGEYGTLDKRKHYHVAFFIDSTISKRDFKSLLDSLWTNGFVYYTQLKHRRLAYILHYHVRPKIVNDKPTFQLFSKNLGSGYFDDDSFREYCIANNTVCVRDKYGKPIPLPRYYRKKFGYDMTSFQSSNVKTILDVIAKSLGKPKDELTRDEISQYCAILFEKDEKKRNKYNFQQKGF